jgi:hypothetical protein
LLLQDFGLQDLVRARLPLTELVLQVPTFLSPPDVQPHARAALEQEGQDEDVDEGPVDALGDPSARRGRQLRFRQHRRSLHELKQYRELADDDLAARLRVERHDEPPAALLRARALLEGLQILDRVADRHAAGHALVEAELVAFALRLEEREALGQTGHRENKSILRGHTDGDRLPLADKAFFDDAATLDDADPKDLLRAFLSHQPSFILRTVRGGPQQPTIIAPVSRRPRCVGFLSRVPASDDRRLHATGTLAQIPSTGQKERFFRRGCRNVTNLQKSARA